MVGGVGVPDEKLREQIVEVESVAADADIDVFTGVEANIAADGSVSVADDLLADLDVVVASPHAALDGDGTDRLVAAAEHPDVNVIGHPTGRYLNRREGLDVDIKRLAEVAAASDTALEINATPPGWTSAAARSSRPSKPGRQSPSTRTHTAHAISNSCATASTRRGGAGSRRTTC